jgi:hypothetical protein
MSFAAEIAAWSMPVFALLLLAAQLVAHELGQWAGRRQRKRAEGQYEGVGIVVGGMLALLAFVLALTLSFANTRFSERRAGTLAEANAIGTAWLRAEAIGQPRGNEIARLLQEYTRLRIDFVKAQRGDAATIDDFNRRTNALQTQIWGHAAAIVREQPNTVSTSLMASLNDAFDASTTERFSYDLMLPPQIFWLLVSITWLSMAALGYQLGLRGQPVRVLVVLLTGMWTLVIVDTLDLASARLGTFRTSTGVYEWTLQSFKGGVPIPPMPASQ